MTEVHLDLMPSAAQWTYTTDQLGVEPDATAEQIAEEFRREGVSSTIRELGLLDGASIFIQVVRPGQRADTAEAVVE